MPSGEVSRHPEGLRYENAGKINRGSPKLQWKDAIGNDLKWCELVPCQMEKAHRNGNPTENFSNGSDCENERGG